MKAIYLEWLDHASAHGWIDAHDLEHLGPVKQHTVGFIVYETSEHVAVSTTINSDGPTCCDPIVVLKALITKRRRVKVPK